MANARHDFSITGESGSMLYREGQPVPDAIAKLYPQHIIGFKEPETPAHNPNLSQKLSRTAATKLSEDELMQWLKQYHPAQVPSGKADKADLVNLVVTIQE